MNKDRLFLRKIARKGKDTVSLVQRFARNGQSRRAMYYSCLRKLGIRFFPVRVRKAWMWIDLHDEVLGNYFFMHREYEPFETLLIERAIQPGMTVADIGANIGYYTLVMARHVGPKGQVIAFEPDPTNFRLLRRNIRMNCFSNVITEQAAVLDRDGKTTLFLSNNNFGDHRVFDTHDYEQFNKGIPRSSIEVRAVTLDRCLNRLGKPADLIKMDIQGAEMLALPGMTKALSNLNVLLFCEFWPYGLRNANTSPRQFLESLCEIGLELFEIIEDNQTVLPVDVDELSQRFPDVGLANLLCAHSMRAKDILSVPQ